MASPLISTNNLNFSFGSRLILDNINLEVPEGSIYGFLGPNGAGKTTTIKTFLGLLHVKTGMIRIFDHDLHEDRLGILDKIGAMVEAPSLYDHLSAKRNIEITRTLRNSAKELKSQKISKKRILEVLETVGLTADMNRPVKQFSTGMKQRLCLAIALLAKPRLLMLDEPINGLDPAGIIEIRNLLVNLNQNENCTVFLSSHILSEIEKFCTHVAVINKGKLLYQGKTQELVLNQIAKDTVIIEVNDTQKAVSLLTDYHPVYNGNHLSIACSNRQDISRAISILVNAEIEVYKVIPEENDLESSFLELIKE